ncbi:MAG: hypothetical protein EKK55_12405 [Rhodocyclaceae bacterium]|nr:MAG: hypothetical protein EKK55_12405 [Rhodocyclaceae bacterium]
MDEFKVGDRVAYRLAPHVTGVIVWIQPEDWMNQWTKAEAAGAWMDRLSDIAREDCRAIGEDSANARWTSKSKACDFDKVRVIVRRDERSKRASQGFPSGSLVYDWCLLRSLRLPREVAP